MAAKPRLDPADVVDVFVYVTVLNLAAQLVPGVITESFAVSLLTAVLLKLVLEVALRVKLAVKARMRTAPTLPLKVLFVGALILNIAGSKFLVLWLEDVLFGDAVSLGGFWEVTLLIFALMGARWGVRWLLALPR